MQFRHEIKTIITPIQAELVRHQISAVCMLDPNTDESGEYWITSVYFDTHNDRFLNETLNGVNIRHKYRIRKYNNDNSVIKLECKSTEGGLKHKDSDKITIDEANLLLNKDYDFALNSDRKVCKGFAIEALKDYMEPVVLIGYERIPYVYPCGNVRITFDYNVCASRRVEDFCGSDMPFARSVCPGGVVLEVKYDEVLPTVIRKILNTTGILWQSAFSKYANARLAYEEWR